MKNSWEEKRLGEVIKLEYGKPLPKDKRISNGKYPVYGANGEKDRTDEFYYDRSSIIVGRKGSAGEINLTEKRFWPLDVTYFVTFDDKKYSLGFLYDLLLTLNLPKLAKGVKPGINRNEVYEIRASFPPLPEQKRIVGILDEAFSAISTAKANAEKNLQNARELFESYLQGVFANPGDGWEVKKLGEVCDISTGKWDANHAVENGEFRFFTCAREPKLCDTKRFSGECLVLPGNGVNVGDVYYYKGDFDAYQRTYVISKIKPYPKYLFYHMLAFWKKRNLNKQYGSATNFLKIGNFNEYEIPLPPLPEQRAIVAKLDALSAETKKLEAIYQQKRADLEELKKSVLQKAFNGELPEVKYERGGNQSRTD